MDKLIKLKFEFDYVKGKIKLKKPKQQSKQLKLAFKVFKANRKKLKFNKNTYNAFLFASLQKFEIEKNKFQVDEEILIQILNQEFGRRNGSEI